MSLMHARHLLLLGAGGAAGAALLAWAARYPRINDITTTPGEPPRFRRLSLLEPNSGRDMSYPAGFRDRQLRAYADLAPIELDAPPPRAFGRVREAARRMPGWEIVAEDAAAMSLEAVAVTPFMRFTDDVVIEVRERAGPGAPPAGRSAVHMRSKSRLGTSDFGANADRIRRFLRLLRQLDS